MFKAFQNHFQGEKTHMEKPALKPRSVSEGSTRGKSIPDQFVVDPVYIIDLFL